MQLTMQTCPACVYSMMGRCVLKMGRFLVEMHTTQAFTLQHLDLVPGATVGALSPSQHTHVLTPCLPYAPRPPLHMDCELCGPAEL
jgi:hypothetical protein